MSDTLLLLLGEFHVVRMQHPSLHCPILGWAAAVNLQIKATMLGQSQGTHRALVPPQRLLTWGCGLLLRKGTFDITANTDSSSLISSDAQWLHPSPGQEGLSFVVPIAPTPKPGTGPVSLLLACHVGNHTSALQHSLIDCC